MFGRHSSVVQIARPDRSLGGSRRHAIAAIVGLATLMTTATGGVAVARDGEPIELTSTVVVTKSLTPIPVPTKTLTPFDIKTLTPVTTKTLTPAPAPTYTLTPTTSHTLTPVVLDPTPSPTPLP